MYGRNLPSLNPPNLNRDLIKINIKLLSTQLVLLFCLDKHNSNRFFDPQI